MAREFCSSCAAFDAELGECHVDPPVPIVLRQLRGRQRSWGWPEVEPGDWCIRWYGGSVHNQQHAGATAGPARGVRP